MDQPAQDAMQRFAAALRKRGARVTRQQVLNLVTLDTIDRLPPEALLARHCASSSFIVAPIIYRALERLVERGLVFKIDLGVGYQYGRVREHPHHHLLCASCRAVIETPDDLFDHLRAELRDRLGFSIRIDHLALFGIRGACQQSPSPTLSTVC